ncbi:MAG: hypothetical protein GXP54_06030 [Deltaproteobacteria bacterium]|nr:hypothetical protein [Deltaproteobacteria bacterium]
MGGKGNRYKRDIAAWLGLGRLLDILGGRLRSIVIQEEGPGGSTGRYFDALGIKVYQGTNRDNGPGVALTGSEGVG